MNPKLSLENLYCSQKSVANLLTVEVIALDWGEKEGLIDTVICKTPWQSQVLLKSLFLIFHHHRYHHHPFHWYQLQFSLMIIVF